MDVNLFETHIPSKPVFIDFRRYIFFPPILFLPWVAVVLLSVRLEYLSVTINFPPKDVKFWSVLVVLLSFAIGLLSGAINLLPIQGKFPRVTVVLLSSSIAKLWVAIYFPSNAVPFVWFRTASQIY